MTSQVSGSLMVRKMETLPDDIQWYIWRMVYTQSVVPDIITKYKIVWEDPSDRLLELCKDRGCIAHGHNELSDLIEDENMWSWNLCVNSKCPNCTYNGFPCPNLTHYGFKIPKLDRQWDANF